MATAPSQYLVSLSFNSVSGFHLRGERPFHGALVNVTGRRNLVDLLCIRPTVIVGLFLQQAIALFVLKTRAGFSIFKWIATLAADFLSQANAGAAFFFDADTVNVKHWFFVNTVSCHRATPPTMSDSLDPPLAFRDNIFYCIRSNDVLSWRHAMDYQELVSSNCRALG
jgi:Na+ dependent nucleoside transporter N-terminus